MMEYARAGDPANFCVTARPDPVLGRPALRLALLILLPWAGVTGSVFLFLGVWPVAVFLAVPVCCLAWTCRHLERHAGDYERLRLEGDRLILETHTPEDDRRLEFNSYWVQVALQPAADGRLLTVRSHGREVVFGHLLSETERQAVGSELMRRLARVRH